MNKNKEDITKIIVLDNGIRVSLQQALGNVVYCGLMVGAGTSNEHEGERGIAHFIEHVLFKGTKKRSALNICYGLEQEGGELNAFTGREDTIVYAIVQKSEFENALEMICDLVFNSTFPEPELEKEKSVVLSEIDSTTCNLSEVIYDKSMEYLFHGDPIGMPVLGTKKSVKSFTADEVRAFVKRNYVNNKMVISVVGDIDEADVKKIASKYTKRYNNHSSVELAQKLSDYKPYKKEFSSDSAQAFCTISNRAYAIKDKRSVALSFLANVLGGPLFSSRLNMCLREEFGLVYDISASYEAFRQTGAFQIYFETAKKNLKRSMKLIFAELEKMREKPMTKTDLEYAKHRFVGQITIQNENLEQRMIDNAKMILSLGRIETLARQTAKINALSAQDLNAVAREIFVPEQLSIISYT